MLKIKLIALTTLLLGTTLASCSEDTKKPAATDNVEKQPRRTMRRIPKCLNIAQLAKDVATNSYSLKEKTSIRKRKLSQQLQA